MGINRIDGKRRDDVLDLIQDFDTIAFKLSASPSHRRLNERWQRATAPVTYVRRNGDRAQSTKRRAKYGSLAKSIVIAGFLLIGAVFGTLIS